MATTSEEDNYKERKVSISEEDLSGMDARLEKSEGEYSKRDLLRFQLPRFLERIEKGEYNPVHVLQEVGSLRKEERDVYSFSPSGEAGWDRISDASQIINEDMDVAEVNAEQHGTIYAWPYRRPCTPATVVRAVARELAEGAPIFSEDMTFIAKELRQSNTVEK